MLISDYTPALAMPEIVPLVGAGFGNFGDSDIPIVPIMIGFGVIFIGMVALQAYMAAKAGAGAERIVDRWIDKRYK